MTLCIHRVFHFTKSHHLSSRNIFRHGAENLCTNLSNRRTVTSLFFQNNFIDCPINYCSFQTVTRSPFSYFDRILLDTLNVNMSQRQYQYFRTTVKFVWGLKYWLFHLSFMLLSTLFSYVSSNNFIITHFIIINSSP